LEPQEGGCLSNEPNPTLSRFKRAPDQQIEDRTIIGRLLEHPFQGIAAGNVKIR